MNKDTKKHNPYTEMKPEDMRVLLKQKDSQIGLLELRLKKAEHLLHLVQSDKRPHKRITPAIPKSFKPTIAGGNPETN
jgi:hypothetical protein